MADEEANDEHKSDDKDCHNDCEWLGAARAAARPLRRRQQPDALVLLHGKVLSSAFTLFSATRQNQVFVKGLEQRVQQPQQPRRRQQSLALVLLHHWNVGQDCSTLQPNSQAIAICHPMTACSRWCYNRQTYVPAVSTAQRGTSAQYCIMTPKAAQAVRKGHLRIAVGRRRRLRRGVALCWALPKALRSAEGIWRPVSHHPDVRSFHEGFI